MFNDRASSYLILFPDFPMAILFRLSKISLLDLASLSIRLLKYIYQDLDLPVEKTPYACRALVDAVAIGGSL